MAPKKRKANNKPPTRKNKPTSFVLSAATDGRITYLASRWVLSRRETLERALQESERQERAKEQKEKCGDCNTPLAAGAKFCGECGARTQEGL